MRIRDKKYFLAYLGSNSFAAEQRYQKNNRQGQWPSWKSSLMIKTCNHNIPSSDLWTPLHRPGRTSQKTLLVSVSVQQTRLLDSRLNPEGILAASQLQHPDNLRVCSSQRAQLGWLAVRQPNGHWEGHDFFIHPASPPPPLTPRQRLSELASCYS